jgi:hypothetical protein
MGLHGGEGRVLPMHAKEMEFKQSDIEAKVTSYWYAILGVVRQVGLTVSLVAVAHYVSKLVSELMFTW